MNLSQLVENLPFLEKRNFADVVVKGVSFHSAQVKPGEVFVAVYGTATDGHQFISEALNRGATAVVVEKESSVPKNIPLFLAADSRVALSQLAARWYGDPSKQIPVIGVTGTNGKTTITYLLEGILRHGGKNPGVLGTINTRYNQIERPSTHTTPESAEIQRILSEMLAAKVDVAVMEVSSHAVDMRRVEDVHFDTVIFTNLTPEHLDYHKSMELYFEAKKRLFSHLLPKGKGPQRAILNADDRYGQKLLESLRNLPTWTFSTKAQSKWDLFVREWSCDLHGMKGVLSTPAGVSEFSSTLIGNFNLSNVLAAVAGALVLEMPLPLIVEALKDFSGVPGRLERMANHRGIHCFVDYAHTPDALKNVLSALKDLDPPKILTIFGCGGDRDRTKRPIMGREVARLSNFAIVTSDNPRTEDPQKIIQEILPGIEEGGMLLGQDCLIEPDRKTAIHLAIEKAKPGEVVLIAGKGHEDYQIIGKEKFHFDDREIAREALKNS